MQNPAPSIKFIFTLRENTEGDSDMITPYCAWVLDDSVRDRLNRLSKLAQSEGIKVVTDEFTLFEDLDLEEELNADISITSHGDPMVDIELTRRVRHAWPINIESEETLNLSTIMMAMGPPNHLKAPVVIKLVHSEADLLILEGDEYEDLQDAVAIAMDLFSSHRPAEASGRFTQETGAKEVYWHTPKRIGG